MPSTTCVFIVLLCGVCSGIPCHGYKWHPATCTYNIGTKCISIGLHLSLPSLMYMNPPFLILKVRHPAVTGVYCIVRDSRSGCSNDFKCIICITGLWTLYHYDVMGGKNEH